MIPTWASAVRLLHRSVAVVLLAFAGWHGGRVAWIEVKAHLAQHFIRRAWRASQAAAAPVRPWRWADTQPVARLTAPAQGVDEIVLAGASGRTLAFGPGHVTGTPLPGSPGNSVVAGHRDTHFAFLRRLRRGDRLLVEDRNRRRRRYLVAAARVVDRGDTRVMADAGDTRLTLVTCYPFDAVRAGGPLRYVVTAVEETDPPGPGPAAPQRVAANVTDSAYTSVWPRSRSTSGEPSGARPLQTP